MASIIPFIRRSSEFDDFTGHGPWHLTQRAETCPRRPPLREVIARRIIRAASKGVSVTRVGCGPSHWAVQARTERMICKALPRVRWRYLIREFGGGRNGLSTVFCLAFGFLSLLLVVSPVRPAKFRGWPTGACARPRRTFHRAELCLVCIQSFLADHRNVGKFCPANDVDINPGHRVARHLDRPPFVGGFVPLGDIMSLFGVPAAIASARKCRSVGGSLTLQGGSSIRTS